jgi:hypothetical protein
MAVERLNTFLIKRNVEYGALAGHIAAWSIFGLIFAINMLMRLQPGTFSVIGMTLGASMPAAMYIGFALHLLTGTIIGLLFGYITTVVRSFKITSVGRSFGFTIISALVSWAVLFLPITIFAVQPNLPEIATMLGQPALLNISSQILAGAIGMHVIYGGVLGLMYYFATLPSPRD